MSCASLKQHIIEHEILGIGNNNSSSGSIDIIDGYPTYVDTSRGNKILSINRTTFSAYRKNKVENGWLTTNDIASSKNSGRMLKKGTICGVSVSNSEVGTFKLIVCKDLNLLTPLLSVDIIGDTGIELSSLNVDFQRSDTLQFYIQGTCYNTIVYIETAWRF